MDHARQRGRFAGLLLPRISDVCPIRFDLYFRRFLNKDRMALNKLPDIDVDFPHDRKDDVVDLIFERYGPTHTAVVGGFSTFQARSAFAEVAKVLGVSEYQVRRFTEKMPHSAARDLVEAVAQAQEVRDLPVTEEPYISAPDGAVPGRLPALPQDASVRRGAVERADERSGALLHLEQRLPDDALRYGFR